ncbi:hypothetical protein I4U23_022833 [Adineta vaga]|nr:hypothetical protein I4U23_022833 [Adineta vaga]
MAKRNSICKVGCVACISAGGATNLKGYVTCTAPGWVYEDCGEGTTCIPNGDCNVYCG